MRQVLVSIMFCLVCSAAGAQRFYYVETNNLVDQLLKSRLEKSDQYVVSTAMESEYTVRTKVQNGKDERELNLEIVLADSVTQKEIFRSSEQFCFTPVNGQTDLLYSMVIRSFLQRRIGGIMLAAKQDHTGIFRESLRARKDKT